MIWPPPILRIYIYRNEQQRNAGKKDKKVVFHFLKNLIGHKSKAKPENAVFFNIFCYQELT
jgi:hypothetical protein